MIIAIDFDGTIVEHEFPKIGPLKKGAKETINKWYEEGLDKNYFPHIPKVATTPTSHLYSLAWNCLPKNRLPKGIAVIGGGLYWPTQGMPLDNDVRLSNELDESQILVNVNLLFYPMFVY